MKMRDLNLVSGLFREYDNVDIWYLWGSDSVSVIHASMCVVLCGDFPPLLSQRGLVNSLCLKLYLNLSHINSGAAQEDNF